MNLSGIITANNVFVREWLNGCLIPLNLCMMVVIMHTVWRQTRFKRGWSHYPGASSACALWWIFFADLMRAILAWVLLRNTQDIGSIATYQTSVLGTSLYIVTAGIALCATLRCIYCLTTAEYRNATWIGALIFTIVFVTVAVSGQLDWLGQYIIERIPDV